MTERAPEIQHDTAAAVDFLRRMAGDQQVVLTSIVPEGQTTTRTFANADDPRMGTWIEQRQGREGIFFAVNPLLRPMTSKASKADVARFSHLWVDLDPRVGEDVEEERRRILKLLQGATPPFSVIVSSGSGYHGYYKLEPDDSLAVNGDVARAQELERYNMQLEKLFGADACHNSDRILRVPGTVNVAGPKKIKKGRKDALAEVVAYTDNVYKISAFTQAVRPKTLSTVVTLGAKPSVTIAGNVPVVGTAELEPWAAENGKTIKPSILAMIATGHDALDPNKHPSRSEPLRAVCCELARMEVPAEMIYAVITGPNAIAESVKEKGRDAHSYAVRQVERAIEAASGPRWDRVDKDGNPIPSRHNTKTALRMLQVECRQDEFRRITLVEHLQLQQYAGALSDDLEIALEELIHKEFGFYPTDGVTNKAIRALALENRFDSLVDHLHALTLWDGSARLDSWLSTYCGADDNAFTREAGALWLTAAVVRAFEPGAKFDYMLVLQGSQGVGKSTAFRILAGDDFFSDAAFLGAKGAREILEATSGVWIQECAELDGISRRDISAIKADISKQEDSGRPAYARNTVTVKRRFVLGGTTNESRFLQDPSGNRRFWPVTVGRIDLQGLRQARDQIIAEALARFRSNDYRLTLSEAAEAIAREAQGLRLVVDEGYSERLEDLQGCIQQVHGMSVVTNEAVYERLGIPVKDRCGGVPRKVADAMRALGWKPAGAARIDGRVQRHYVWAGEGKPAEPLPF